MQYEKYFIFKQNLLSISKIAHSFNIIQLVEPKLLTGLQNTKITKIFVSKQNLLSLSIIVHSFNIIRLVEPELQTSL